MKSKPKLTKYPSIRRIKPKVQLEAQSYLKKFLMCRPTFYGIEYKINPWMSLDNQANSQLAIEQWNNLCDRIKEHSGDIVCMKPREGLPDMVFTANAGLLLNTMFIVSSFKHPERQKEQWWFNDFFRNQNTPVYIPHFEFEGAGDALFHGNFLIGGFGFRSTIEIYSELQGLVPQEIIIVKLVDPRFYHLDTCFCPLNDMDYIIYPGAFEADCLDQIRKISRYEITVPENEAQNFACNAVQIGNTVILPQGCPETMKQLDKRGYNPVAVPMSEFIKSGGGPKCLTFALN